MSSQQCPCAKLFKIGDDYTREHHENCGIAKAEKFGQLIEQGKKHLRERIQRDIEQSKANLLASIEQTRTKLDELACISEEAEPIPSKVIKQFFEALEYAQKNCP